MASIVNEAVSKVRDAIDRATENLNEADYRKVLDEVTAECACRMMALDDDESGG